MELTQAVSLAISGLNAQTERMRIVSRNLANADTTSDVNGGEPYRRRLPLFREVYDRERGHKIVEVREVIDMSTSLVRRHEPGHPAADSEGFVSYPNVQSLVEMMEMRAAQRAFEANLHVVSSSRAMMGDAIALLRR